MSSSSASTPPHPMVGKELGNYVLRSVLGEGGMGIVFLAEHRFLGDRVAIKILHGTYANQPAIAERFFQEAKAARDIGHPSIIAIRDFGQAADGGLYVVMELLEGESLSSRIARGPLSEPAAATLGAAIAEGLAAAHHKGIIHRDLKPDNIFLVGERVKILDFGIAKVLHAAGKTTTGTLLGTPRYMAPEQARAGSQLGPQADIYSLGVILFQLLTGQTPFDGPDMVAVLGQVLFDAPPRPSTLAPVTPAFEALILRCLEKDPAARPASMAELQQALLALATAPSAAPAAAPAATPAAGGKPNPAPARPSAARAVAPDAPTQLVPVLAQKPPGSTTISGSASEVVLAQGPKTQRRLLVLGGSAALATFLGIGGLSLSGVFREKSEPSRPEEAAPSSPVARPAAVPAPPPSAVPSMVGANEPPPSRPAPSAPAATTATPTPPIQREPRAELPEPAAVTLQTQPAGARVLVDGQDKGTTPLELRLALPREVTVALTGYRTVRRMLEWGGPLSITLEPLAQAAPPPPEKPKTARAPAPPRPKKAAAPKPGDVTLD